MTLNVANNLRKSLAEGYGGDLISTAWNSPDAEMLINLEKNIYSFSAAKNYQELQAFSRAIIDGEDVRSWNDYRKEILQINSTFNNNWLRTEYDTTIGSAQMASRWVQFEKDSDIYESLEYDTAGDSAVRISHAVLDGIVQPKNSQFWQIYYPPNGWKCRCGAKQTNKQASDLPEIDVDKTVPPMFRTNLAKSGLVFPKKHPYYNGIPASIKNGSEVRMIQRAVVTDWCKTNLNGNTVKSTIGNVEFTMTGIREAVNQPHENYVEKNFALFHVREAIAKAKPDDITTIGDVKAKDKSNPNKRVYYYIPIEVAGKTSYINIHRIPEGALRFYSITDRIKNK